VINARKKKGVKMTPSLIRQEKYGFSIIAKWNFATISSIFARATSQRVTIFVVLQDIPELFFLLFP